MTAESNAPQDPGAYEIIRYEGCIGQIIKIVNYLEIVTHAGMFIFPLCSMILAPYNIRYILEELFFMLIAVFLFICVMKFKKLERWLCKYCGFFIDEIHRGVFNIFIGLMMLTHFTGWYYTLMSIVCFIQWACGLLLITLAAIYLKKNK